MGKDQGKQVQFANTAEERQTEIELVRDYYSNETLFDWWIKHPFRHHILARYHPHIERLMGERGRGLTIVEVGSGVGVDLTLLLRRYPSIGAIGFDLSSEGVWTSAQYGLGEYFVADAENPALSDDCCDVVLLLNVLHHFYRYPDRVLSEVDRILRPGGLLLLRDPNAGRTARLAAIIASRGMRLVNLWTSVLRRPVFDLEIPPPSPTEKCIRYEDLRQALETRFEIVERGFADCLTHLARWHAFPYWLLRLLDKVIHFVDPRSLVFYSFVCRSLKP